MLKHFALRLKHIVIRNMILAHVTKFGTPQLLVIDFYGCLTDDYMLVDQNGVEHVKVLRKDGLDISRLKSIGVKVVIISTDANAVVMRRTQKMKVECFQGVGDKLVELERLATSLGIIKSRI